MSGDTRVAAVTGAARAGGIGRAIARRLLLDGYQVVVSDLVRPMESHPDYEGSGAADLDDAVTELSQLGAVHGVPCDVRRAHDADALVQAALDRFGRLDALVNNAGIAIGLTPVVDLSEADWRVNLDVMATGTFLCSRAAARVMVEQGQGGRILNIASQAGKTGMPLLAAYCAAKFAVLGLTQVLAHELGPHGITVNAVCPGTVDTPLLGLRGGMIETYAARAGITPDQYRTRVLRTIPLGRLETPDDVAAAVAFLASPDAAYITGESLNVTGGQTMA